MNVDWDDDFKEMQSFCSGALWLTAAGLLVLMVALLFVILT